MAHQQFVGRGMGRAPPHRLGDGCFALRPQPVAQHGEGRRHRAANPRPAMNQQRRVGLPGAGEGEQLRDMIGGGRMGAGGGIGDIIDPQPEVTLGGKTRRRRDHVLRRQQRHHVRRPVGGHGVLELGQGGDQEAGHETLLAVILCTIAQIWQGTAPAPPLSPGAPDGARQGPWAASRTGGGPPARRSRPAGWPRNRPRDDRPA